MSIFRPLHTDCPACNKPVAFNVVASVNADLRPDLREAILEQRFQRESCPACATAFRIEPAFSYLDQELGLWLLVHPCEELGQWPSWEVQARTLHDTAFGASAGPSVRALGERLRPRVCFGWAALREKLLCARHGLDDVGLELLKLSLLAGTSELALADDHELRLMEVEAQTLQLVWLRASSESALETLSVPRALCEQIQTDPAWAELRERLAEGVFVDLDRLLVPPPRGPGDPPDDDDDEGDEGDSEGNAPDTHTTPQES